MSVAADLAASYGDTPSLPPAFADEVDQKPVSYAVQRLDSLDAFRLCIVPLRFEGEALIVGIANVGDTATLREVEMLMKISQVRPEFMQRREIFARLNELYPQASRGVASGLGETSGIEIWTEVQSITFRRHAQDILVEPLDRGGIVRWYVDGVFDNAAKAVDYFDYEERAKRGDRCALSLDDEHYQMLVRRLAAVAHLREGVPRQLESLRLRRDVAVAEARINRYQTVNGFAHFIRRLGSSEALLPLSEIGMSEDVRHRFRAALRAPAGLHIIGGPPGTGKNTTATAGIATLDNASGNTITVEQPCEVRLPYVNHTELTPDESPVEAFKALLTMQPTLVYANQILSPEMAQAIFGAGRAGFQVLTTVHADNVFDILDRLSIDFGVDYGSAVKLLSTLVAQKLARRLCSCATVCRVVPDELFDLMRRFSDLSRAMKNGMLRSPKDGGCGVCAGTGFNGLIGVFELLEMTPGVREAFAARGSDRDLLKVARSAGYVPMAEAALTHVVNGIISLETAVDLFGRRALDFATMEVA